jgi:hypothetical protein
MRINTVSASLLWGQYIIEEEAFLILAGPAAAVIGAIRSRTPCTGIGCEGDHLSFQL